MKVENGINYQLSGAMKCCLTPTRDGDNVNASVLKHLLIKAEVMACCAFATSENRRMLYQPRSPSQLCRSRAELFQRET